MRQLILIILILFSVGVYAQIETDTLPKKEFTYFQKGKKKLRINPPLSWRGYFGVVGIADLRYSYFLMNNFAIGMEGRYMSNFGSFSGYGGGASVRQYLLSRKFSPFTEVNYFFEKNHFGIFGYNININSHKIRGLGGIAYTGIADKYGVEVFIGAEQLYVNVPSYNVKENFIIPTGGLRFNYHF